MNTCPGQHVCVCRIVIIFGECMLPFALMKKQTFKIYIIVILLFYINV
jgi:hypothetical protein